MNGTFPNCTEAVAAAVNEGFKVVNCDRRLVATKLGETDRVLRPTSVVRHVWVEVTPNEWDFCWDVVPKGGGPRWSFQTVADIIDWLKEPGRPAQEKFNVSFVGTVA